MKKLSFSVFAAALTFGVNAADKAKEAAAPAVGSVFDGIYVGAGITAIDDGVRTWNSSENETESDHKVKLAGSLALGYGKVIKEKAYLGLEAGLDVSQHSEFNEKEVMFYKQQNKWKTEYRQKCLLCRRVITNTIRSC